MRRRRSCGRFAQARLEVGHGPGVERESLHSRRAPATACADVHSEFLNMNTYVECSRGQGMWHRMRAMSLGRVRSRSAVRPVPACGLCALWSPGGAPPLPCSRRGHCQLPASGMEPVTAGWPNNHGHELARIQIHTTAGSGREGILAGGQRGRRRQVLHSNVNFSASSRSAANRAVDR